MPRPPLYQERVHSQTLSWAKGHPYHDKLTDECCPDFSCCRPDMFTKNEAERWDMYRKRYGSN